MRKLVTIRTIQEVVPIEGADAIEVVKIDGWQCVAKKGEFSATDQCLYYEVDSFLPATEPRYDFLAGRGVQTNGDGSKGYRLRTIRLRGQLSQGLALPLKDFPFLDVDAVNDETDLAELLGVTKYEPALPAQLSGQAKGTFPAFIQKTDQERIQNIPWMLQDPGEWEVTQKLDGSSCTIFYNDGEFGVCSRNLELKETEGNSFWNIANKYRLKEKLEALGMNIALQGELCGPGIQQNPHGLQQADFFLFDIFLIDKQEYASPSERSRLKNTEHLQEIKEVPFITVRTLDGLRTVDAVLALAEQTPCALNAKNTAPEGLVFKSMDGGKSFKAISNKFLLKKEK